MVRASLTADLPSLPRVDPATFRITRVLDLVRTASDHYALGGHGDVVDVAVSEIFPVGFLAAESFGWHFSSPFLPIQIAIHIASLQTLPTQHL